MKTAELEGALLDYWAARADGYVNGTVKEAAEAIDGDSQPCVFTTPAGSLRVAKKDSVTAWAPSTDWAQGGPIVDRELISLCADPLFEDHLLWAARKDGIFHENGPTALIAAMRCLVASKFGEEVPDSVA